MKFLYRYLGMIRIPIKGKIKERLESYTVVESDAEKHV